MTIPMTAIDTIEHLRETVAKQDEQLRLLRMFAGRIIRRKGGPDGPADIRDAAVGCCLMQDSGAGKLFLTSLGQECIEEAA